MKRLLLIVLPLLLIVGCSKPINEETLIEKGGLKYHPDTRELYNGDVYMKYIGGKKKLEGSYKEGKKDGLFTWWYDNGQMKQEGKYKDGEPDGLFTLWYENGQKEIERPYKDGYIVGPGKKWNEDGSVKE